MVMDHRLSAHDQQEQHERALVHVSTINDNDNNDDRSRNQIMTNNNNHQDEAEAEEEEETNNDRDASALETRKRVLGLILDLSSDADADADRPGKTVVNIDVNVNVKDARDSQDSQGNNPGMQYFVRQEIVQKEKVQQQQQRSNSGGAPDAGPGPGPCASITSARTTTTGITEEKMKESLGKSDCSLVWGNQGEQKQEQNHATTSSSSENATSINLEMPRLQRNSSRQLGFTTSHSVPGAFAVHHNCSTRRDFTSPSDSDSDSDSTSTSTRTNTSHGHDLDLEMCIHVMNYEEQRIDDSPDHVHVHDHDQQQQLLGDEIPVVTAAEVTEDQLARLEEEIREKIIHEAVEADVVKITISNPQPQPQQNDCQPDKDNLSPNSTAFLCLTQHWRRLVVTLLLLLALLGVAVLVVKLVLATDNNNNDHTSNTIDVFDPDTQTPATPTTVAISSTQSTLEEIRERGFIRCGALVHLPGISTASPNMQGMAVDLCRASAVAVFQDPNKFTLRELNCSRDESFVALANRSLDVLTDIIQHSMGRDVYNTASQTGFVFSTPYLYAQSKFVGVPEFVDCADNLDALIGPSCRSLKVCVSTGSIQEKVLRDLLPGSVTVPFLSTNDCINKWNAGECNVIIGNTLFLSESIMREFGYEGRYKQGSKIFASGPLSLLTRTDDMEFSSLVNLAVNALFMAEAANITKENAKEMIPQLFHQDDYPDLASLMESIVSTVGNYGDLYSKNLEALIPRQGLNELYKYQQDITGLLYSFPFGLVDTVGPGPIPEMTLDTVSRRGFLRCGVEPREGFASTSDSMTDTLDEDDQLGWTGLDVELCRALAAAIFAGEQHRVEFVNVSDTDSNWAGSMFRALAMDDVDVVAGSRITLQAGYHEPTTGMGYTFSRPYFFNAETGNALALMTRLDDPQWSDFVFWVVNALIYAEEHDIQQDKSVEQLPIVSLFGEGLKQMFRDEILAVGSYADVYNRTLEPLIPRSGPNLLNRDPFGPQHFPIPFI